LQSIRFPAVFFVVFLLLAYKFNSTKQKCYDKANNNTDNTSVEVYGIYDKIHLQLCVKGMKPSDSYFTTYTNPRKKSKILPQGTEISYEVLACMKVIKIKF